MEIGVASVSDDSLFMTSACIAALAWEPLL